MNILTGALKHHLACVQVENKKKVTNDVQSAYIFIFLEIEHYFGCGKKLRLFVKKKEQETNSKWVWECEINETKKVI